MPETEEKRSENIQAMLRPSERQRLEWLAEQENQTVSNMARVLILDSLKVWEASNPGRKTRKR